MHVIFLVLLAVQLVCIAMGVPYGQPINRQPVGNQATTRTPVVNHQYFRHSTIAAPEKPIYYTISFPMVHRYPTISIPKDTSVFTTSTDLTLSNPIFRNTVHTALDHAPNTPVNRPNGVPHPTTSFSSNNPETLLPERPDSFIEYPTTITSPRSVLSEDYFYDHGHYPWIRLAADYQPDYPEYTETPRMSMLRACARCSVRMDSGRCVFVRQAC